VWPVAVGGVREDEKRRGEERRGGGREGRGGKSRGEKEDALRRKGIRTMCNGIVLSFLCVLCFLLGRGRVPDRFLVRCMLVCVLLQRHLCLEMKEFMNQL
jgi:hypothetical protein